MKIIRTLVFVAALCQTTTTFASFTEEMVGLLADQFKQGNYLPDKKLREQIEQAAEGYVPDEDERSVQGLVNRHLIIGENKAFWYQIKLLCDRGNPNAWVYWGQHLLFENDVEPNDAFYQSMALLAMGTIAGSPVASMWLGDAFLVLKEEGWAIEFYKKSTDFPFGATNYALMLVKDGVVPDEAIEILTKAAVQGDPVAASGLASCYQTKGDMVQAMTWSLISNRGLMSMDKYMGMLPMLNLIKDTQFTKDEKKRIWTAYLNWFNKNPGVLTDGFDEEVFAARPLYKGAKTWYPPEDTSTALGAFWSLYAVGKKQPLYNLIKEADQAYKQWGQRDFWCLGEYVMRGFGGPTDFGKQWTYMNGAFCRSCPLTMLDYYMFTVESAVTAYSYDEPDVWKDGYECLEGVELYYEDFPGNTAYQEAGADATFLYGYLQYIGLGTDKNEEKGLEWIKQVQYQSPMAFAFMATFEQDPVKQYAMLEAIYPDFTRGDSYFGFCAARALGQKLTVEQRIAGKKMAAQMRVDHPMIAYNIYQRYALGLGLPPMTRAMEEWQKKIEGSALRRLAQRTDAFVWEKKQETGGGWCNLM